MRTITANETILNTDTYIVCNSTSDIFLSLPKSTASGQELVVKNISTGSVYLSPVVGDAIDGGTAIIISQWEAVKITDDVAGVWLVTPYQIVSDIVGANPAPVTRTNNPIVGTATVNANIAKLDAAIGTDAQITPVTRTTGQVVVNNTVHQKIDSLDSAIGFDAQLSGSRKNISPNNTIYQNFDSLDIYKSVRTIKKTIGAPGLAGTDFNFTSAANKTEQSIDLGALIPAKARLVDVFVHCDAVFTNAVSMAVDVGTTSGGGDLIGSGSVYSAGQIIAAANAGAFIATPSATATNVFINATPGANWDQFTAGSMSVYVTIIDVTGV